MKKLILILSITFIHSMNVQMFAQDVTMQWANGMGGNGSDEAFSIDSDNSGNSVVTGSFSTTVDFDPGTESSSLTSAGSFDCFIAKYNSNGTLAWAKQIGGPNGDKGLTVKIDGSSNIIVSGWFNGTVDFDPGVGITSITSAGFDDIFFLKLDSSGNLVWVKTIGGTGSENAISMDVDGSGNIYSTGYFFNTLDFNPAIGINVLTSAGAQDAFVLKLNSSGDFVWAKNVGGTQADNGKAISVDPSGNVYFTGTFEGAGDFDPGATIVTLTPGSLIETFIVKLDNSGIFSWAKQTTTTFICSSTCIDSDISNVVIGGYFNNSCDFDPSTPTINLTALASDDIFLLKLTNSGNFVWVKQIGGTGSERIHSIVFDSSSDIIGTGIFSGTIDCDPNAGSFNLSSAGIDDVFITKIKNAGTLDWAKRIGGTANDKANSVDVNSIGNVFTTGFFNGTADFNDGTGTFNLTAVANGDIFVQKMTLCESSSSTSVGACGSYTWPATAITYTTSGTYNTTLTNSRGCDSTLTLLLTIDPTPTVTVSATDNNLCAGESTTLTGGGADTYTYTGGVTNGVPFAPSSTTTYTIIGTYSISGCSSTNTILITVNSLPTVVANATDANLCAGESTTLTGTGANTYTWTGGVSNGISFVPSSTITYTVTGTNTATGCTDTDAILISVNSLPAVVANSTDANLCAGESTTLTGSGANTYTWTGGVSNGVSFVPSTTNTYTVTGTNTATGCVNTDDVLITVTTINNNVTFSGGVFNADQAGASYQWLDCNTGNTAIVGASSQSYSPTASSSYAVEISLNGCVDTSSCQTFNNIESIANENSKISIYPNPTDGIFFIDGLTDFDSEIIVLDITGKVVQVISNLDSKVCVDISHLTKGTYFIRTSFATHKIIKY